jgi:hypothetical protein
MTTFATLPLLPASGVKENSHFIFSKTPESRPSQPLKLHRLRKYANINQ